MELNVCANVVQCSFEFVCCEHVIGFSAYVVQCSFEFKCCEHIIESSANLIQCSFEFGCCVHVIGFPAFIENGIYFVYLREWQLPM